MDKIIVLTYCARVIEKKSCPPVMMPDVHFFLYVRVGDHAACPGTMLPRAFAGYRFACRHLCRH